jgi:hypothetical protein
MLDVEITRPDLLCLIRNIELKESNNNGSGEKCLICRLAIDDTNSVRLPCGHAFHIDYYSTSVKRKKRCPYCQKSYSMCEIEHKCQYMSQITGKMCSEITPIQNKLCKAHNVKRCVQTLIRGKRTGCQCQKKAVQCINDEWYCKQHASNRSL